MKKFRITRYFDVLADSEEEALELLRNAENEIDECVETGEDIEEIKN